LIRKQYNLNSSKRSATLGEHSKTVRERLKQGFSRTIYKGGCVIREQGTPQLNSVTSCGIPNPVSNKTITGQVPG